MAAKSDAEHYAKEREREKREVVEIPHEEMREVAEVFQAYGLSEDETWPIVQALKRQPRNWVDFMMRFELGLEKPDPRRALTSALTIAGAYVAGGLIPLSPIFFLRHDGSALLYSVWLYTRSVVDFWICKRALHRNSSIAKRPSDCIDWKRRRRRGIRYRPLDRRISCGVQAALT